jgi:hypothetical protein
MGGVLVGRARARALCVVVVALMVAVTSLQVARTSAAGAINAPLGNRVGVSAGSHVLWTTAAERRAELDFIAASGAKWFGIDVDWPSIQPTRHRWNWSHTDAVVLDARARGLSIIGTLAYAPRWAVPATCPANTTHCFPAKAADFNNFAREAVKRYGNASPHPQFRGSITTWQVWNEANHYPFVQPVVDVLGYTHLLRTTYLSIKSADMYARVLAGGTSPAGDDPVTRRDMSPLTFLRSLYYFGAKGYFDAFAHHPYSFPCSPLTQAPWNAFEQTAALYWEMARHGDGAKKIWGTETGAPTGADVGVCASGQPGVSVTEPVQALYVHEYLWGWTVKFGAFTGPLIWFHIRDAGTNRWDRNHNFGLLRRNWVAKPSYQVFSTLMRGG